MSNFVACRLDCRSVLVMNASTMNCVVNRAITRGVVRGISEKLNGCAQIDAL